MGKYLKFKRKSHAHNTSLYEYDREWRKRCKPKMSVRARVILSVKLGNKK